VISAGFLISERVILKRDRFFAVSARDGSMKAGEFSGDGLWDGDTRILSGLRVLINGVEPVLLRLVADDASATFELDGAGLHVVRERFVDSGLHERIKVTNPGPETVEARIDLVVEADFAAMLGIRGAVPQLAHPTPVPLAPTEEGARFDHPSRPATRVIATPAGLVHHLRLLPGDEFTLRVDALPDTAEPGVDFVIGLESSRRVYSHWAEECVSIRTDNTAVNKVLDRALADIRMLMNAYDSGMYPTGGLPWFAVPFGRDTLISSMLLLPVNPEIARGVLRYQAAHQGRRIDESTLEEPGKILHEVRDGEVVERGLWPHILYTTVDATALFLCTLAETEGWTHDRKLAGELWPAAQAALEWCSTFGDVDGDGFIEDRGIRYRNAGWKDSFDSLTNVDGSEVLRPVALCEVQAYLHRGLAGMSRQDRALGLRAKELKRRFNREFWMPRARFIAQALDASKQPVEAITSNPGHCLWMQVLDRPKAAHVVRRLLSPEMFSGWGVRTLSDGAVNYDPCSYHNGSVWPFDSALAMLGLRRYGFAAEAERVARALIQAALEFPMKRPPELFCGDPRVPGMPPREYWNTCTPQLWSAAAMFACVTAILGLEADPRRKSLRVAPVETELWNRVEVRGLHFAGRRLDFVVEGTKVTPGLQPPGFRII